MVQPTLRALLVPAPGCSYLLSSSDCCADMRTVPVSAIARAAESEFNSALSASTNPKRLHPPSEAQTRQRTSVNASSPTRQQHPLGRFRLQPGRPSHLAQSVAEDGKLARKLTNSKLTPTRADGRSDHAKSRDRQDCYPALLGDRFQSPAHAAPTVRRLLARLSGRLGSG